MADGKEHNGKKKKVFKYPKVDHNYSVNLSDYFSNIYFVDCSKRNIVDVVKEILRKRDKTAS